MQPQDPSKKRCFWHFNSAKWEDLRQYHSDFLWDDNCFHVRDTSLLTERITEVIVSGMDLYIPHTFSNTKAKKPWFNPACSRAVKDREATHKLCHFHILKTLLVPKLIPVVLHFILPSILILHSFPFLSDNLPFTFFNVPFNFLVLFHMSNILVLLIRNNNRNSTAINCSSIKVEC